MPSTLVWPADQLWLTKEQIDALSVRCHQAFASTLKRLQIDTDLDPLLPSMYIPLAAWLEQHRDKKDAPLVVGLCGAQGSGKSTVTELLKTVQTIGFDRTVASFSIDDIYMTSEERQRLARTVHPLFATRGVPGTHDVELGIETIQQLKQLGPGQTMQIPMFDKAKDTREPRAVWPICEGSIDFIIFEGWCVGARPQCEAALKTPLNSLEENEDKNGTWRKRVNRHLEEAYQTLFDLIDVLLLLEVEGMHKVFEWRRLQEHKLSAAAAQAGADVTQLAIMSDQQVDRFVMHYERLTRHILDEMPQRADIIFSLDDSHTPARVSINHPL